MCMFCQQLEAASVKREFPNSAGSLSTILSTQPMYTVRQREGKHSVATLYLRLIAFSSNL